MCSTHASIATTMPADSAALTSRMRPPWTCKSLPSAHTAPGAGAGWLITSDCRIAASGSLGSGLTNSPVSPAQALAGLLYGAITSVSLLALAKRLVASLARESARKLALMAHMLVPRWMARKLALVLWVQRWAQKLG